MPRKGYALSETEARDFNRMRANWRRRAPAKARRSPRRRRHGGGTPAEDTANGFPDGVACDCDHCLEGVPIPDANETTGCCKSHITWTLTNPWLTCTTTELDLEFAGLDQWYTDVFDGANGNEYRYHLAVDVQGRTYLTLELVTDNDGGDVCLRYGRDGFDCQCDNALTIKKPFGQLSGLERNDVSCNVCLKPDADIERSDCRDCDIPTTVIVTIDGFADGACDNCESQDGVFALEFETFHESLNLCQWVYRFDDWAAQCNADNGPATGYVNFTMRRVLETDDPPVGAVYLLSVQLSLSTAGSGVATEGYGWTAFATECPSGTIELTDEFVVNPSTNCTPPDTVTVLIPSNSAPATGSGACEDEDCGAVAPPDPPGACCYQDECLDYADAALCSSLGGTWYDDADDCAETCEEIGSCCLGLLCIDGSTRYQCGLYGGIFTSGDCTGCDSTGACCRASGGCDADVLPGDCTGPGETHYPGEDCTGKSCEGTCCCDGPETCCYGQGFTYEECIGDGSTPTGEIYACSETPTWIADSATCDDCSAPGGC